MTTLDKYLCKRLLGTFLKTTVSLLTLFIVIDILTHRRPDVLEQDVPMQIVIEYYLLYIPVMLNNFHMAPLSLLISGLLVFGTFVQRVEYTAMLASGIGLKRMLLAPFIVAFTVGLGMLGMNETLGTYAAERTHDIEYHYFGKIRSGDRGNREGIFWAQLENDWKCDIRKFNRQAMTGEHIFLYAHHEDYYEQIEAKRIIWDADSQTWLLEDGIWNVYHPDRGWARSWTRITQINAPFQADPKVLFSNEIDTRTQSIAGLHRFMNKHTLQGRIQRRITVDYHTKFVNPLLCILFMGLAIPFSIRLGRGNVSIGLSVAIFLGLIYIILSSVAQSMGYSGQVSPILAAWIPFAVYFFVSSVLIYKTPT